MHPDAKFIHKTQLINAVLGPEALTIATPLTPFILGIGLYYF